MSEDTGVAASPPLSHGYAAEPVPVSGKAGIANAEHTPGPWSVPHFAVPEGNCQCGYVLTDHLMGAVCKVYASGEGDDWASHGDNPKFAEAVANARLIAAAPELLAQLEAMTAHYVNLAGCGDCGNWDPEAEPEVIAARATIAKATGS